MADNTDLKSVGVYPREGSSPSLGTSEDYGRQASSLTD